MTWSDLQEEGRVVPHRTSVGEIEDLGTLVTRGLTDARSETVSLDLRFAAAYGAALSLATIVLCASGYRTTGVAHHATALAALPLALGPEVQETADYLDVCRRKRNVLEYRRAGQVSEVEVAELVAETATLAARVRAWLEREHAGLAP